MIRWIYKFLFMLCFYGGAMSFGANFARVTGRTPSTWSEWDIYTAIALAFFCAFFDWKKYL